MSAENEKMLANLDATRAGGSSTQRGAQAPAQRDILAPAMASAFDTAYLGNDGRYTVFRFGNQQLKFIAPYSLERYVQVKEWDNGYLVTMAKYAHDDQPIEEYIDLIPVLERLYMDK